MSDLARLLGDLYGDDGTEGAATLSVTPQVKVVSPPSEPAWEPGSSPDQTSAIEAPGDPNASVASPLDDEILTLQMLVAPDPADLAEAGSPSTGSKTPASAFSAYTAVGDDWDLTGTDLQAALGRPGTDLTGPGADPGDANGATSEAGSLLTLVEGQEPEGSDVLNGRAEALLATAVMELPMVPEGATRWMRGDDDILPMRRRGHRRRR
jgi:hypothetical protein